MSSIVKHAKPISPETGISQGNIAFIRKKSGTRRRNRNTATTEKLNEERTSYKEMNFFQIIEFRNVKK